MIQRSWEEDVDGPPMFQVTKKIINCRMELDRWQRVTFGKRSREIENTRLQLQEVFDAPITEDSTLQSAHLQTKT